MKKFVTIYRRESAARLPQEIKDGAVLKLSSGITSSGIPLKGITIEEEEKLLPTIVGVPANHIDFFSKVNTWYNNLSKPVTKEGLKLNISVSAASGMPEAPIDYLLYKRALVDRRVAKSKQLLLSDQFFTFYINDETEEQDKKIASLREKETAQKEYFKVKESEVLVDWILQVYAQSLGEKTSKYGNLSKEDKDLILDKMVTTLPKMFVNLAQDKDLELKAEILSMVDYQVITKAGNKFINGTEPIGDTLDEAIAYFKSAKNQTVYVQLKAKLEALGYKIKKEKKLKDAN
jgi:hypothetical protein